MSEAEHDPELPEKPPVSIGKRLLVGSGLFIVLLLGLGLAHHYVQGSRAKSQLTRALEELDESDPGWRLEDIEAARPDPAEEDNSARVAMAARRLIPKGALDYRVMEPLDKLPPPPELLDAARAQLLDRELLRVSAALQQARRLADMPVGRHRLMFAHNPINTLLEDQQNTRTVFNLLRYDVLNESQKGNAKQALSSGKAILNAARSLDDEPLLISQLIRIAGVAVAGDAIERALALGEPPDKELAGLQALVEQEEAHPTLIVGLRGERASLHRLYRGVADGSIDATELFAGGPNARMDLGARFMGWHGPSMARREHPRMLKLMGQVIDNARLPPHEQAAAEKKLDAEMRSLRDNGAILTSMLVPAVVKVSEATRRKLALVRCLKVVAALERYRKEKGGWPGKLEELTPKLLSAVPLDPYDGKPLRYRVGGGGVVVYSVGPDGSDNGGNINHERPTEPGTDLGYHLWDVKQRRQQAKPPPAPAAPPEAPRPPEASHE
jgi:hypothetical protein